MNDNMPVSRRGFLSGAPALLAQRNVNSRLGVAAIGVGTRGYQLLREAQECPNTEISVVCDLYDANIKRAADACPDRKPQVTKDWEKALGMPGVDVVIIATPDFWHAPMTIRAAEAKKDIYVEKGLCRTLDEAKRIRKAVKDNNVVLQLGHHYNSQPTYHRAREIYKSGQLGKVTLVRTYIDRTNPFPEWQFYTAYNIQNTPGDATPETIDWERFISNAPKRPFDAQRFFRWRCWWEYGTGIAGDLMSHQWDGVNMIMGMGIPESAVTQGGLYYWKEDREVPDMWHVVFDYPKQELAILFGCTFHNRHMGTTTQILGRDASLEVESSFCRLYGGEWKPEFRDKLARARKEAAEAGRNLEDVVIPPDYSMKRGELTVSGHMRDFIDCVRSRQLPRCHIGRAFEEAVAIVMSVDSFRQGRKVRWDPAAEDIV